MRPSITELKQRFEEAAEAGEPVRIVREGRAVATPAGELEAPKRRLLGLVEGGLWIPHDLDGLGQGVGPHLERDGERAMLDPKVRAKRRSGRPPPPARADRKHAAAEAEGRRHGRWKETAVARRRAPPRRRRTPDETAPGKAGAVHLDRAARRWAARDRPVATLATTRCARSPRGSARRLAHAWAIARPKEPSAARCRESPEPRETSRPSAGRRARPRQARRPSRSQAPTMRSPASRR